MVTTTRPYTTIDDLAWHEILPSIEGEGADFETAKEIAQALDEQGDIIHTKRGQFILEMDNDRYWAFVMPRIDPAPGDDA